MDIIKLKTRQRTGTGKSYTRKVRQQGWIPAVYYGHDRQTMSIEVDLQEFSKLVREHKTTHLIDLTLSSAGEASITIIKEIQKHVLKDNVFYHIDFQHVSMDEKISVNCPIRIVGKAIGVKEDGGILEQTMRTISIQCLPINIPEFINVEVSNLRVGDAFHVKDLSLPNIEFNSSPEDVIAVVVQPHSAERETPAVEGGVEGAEAAEGAEASASDSKKEEKDSGK